VDSEAEYLWEILSRNGYRLGIFEVPMNYPPRKVNGFIVCGMWAPRDKRYTTYPEGLHKELAENINGYEDTIMPFNPGNAHKRYKKTIEIRKEVIKYLMENKNGISSWDTSQNPIHSFTSTGRTMTQDTPILEETEIINLVILSRTVL